MRFLDSHGWSMGKFRDMKLGPIVVEDKLTYAKELALLEPFYVDLSVLEIGEDGRRMRDRNRFFREKDKALAATVESVVLWFDLVARKPVAPPADLHALWTGLAADNVEA